MSAGIFHSRALGFAKLMVVITGIIFHVGLAVHDFLFMAFFSWRGRDQPHIEVSEFFSWRGIDRPNIEVSEPTRAPIHPSGVEHPPINPMGGCDLFPGPGAGAYPTRSCRHAGGSMLIGPNDPLWFGEEEEEPGSPAGQPGVPPGARFDPYGPPGVPGFEPIRFARNLRRRPGGTHPDLEHFGDGSDVIQRHGPEFGRFSLARWKL